MRMLYATAVVPAATGNGLAMRAAMTLDTFRQFYDVSVATPFESPTQGNHYDIVHVFRMSGLAVARPYLDSATCRHLDLDDIDSKTHRRIAAVCRANGDLEVANRELAESRRCELLEVAMFRKFHRVYVCSETDRQELSTRCPAELLVLPNAVQLPEPIPLGRDRSKPYRFLFIGTMGYYPNMDGCLWFCRQVLPILERIAPRDFRVDLAGTGSFERLGDHKRLHVHGAVSDVRPLYESCDAAIIPLRAGGGTRIKILEAFSFGRPVVSTTLGAEGIAAADGTHILLGDSPEEFAAQCLALMQDPSLAKRLVQDALRLVATSYSAQALKRIVASLPMAPVRQGSQ